MGRGGKGSWRLRSRAGPGGPGGGGGGGAGRAGGRPGGGMAEPSGAETRPQIRVTVKTPKDKEEIVICDQASVKEVVGLARERGGREQRTEGSAQRGRPRGRPGAGNGPPTGAEPRGIQAGEAGRGRPTRASPGSVARVGADLAALPGLGAWWGSLRKGHLACRLQKDLGLRGVCARVTGGGSRR